ncbi:MAG: hypothetical protein LKJ06_07895 [Schleiferilactobacillus harbinensis]|jgi:hypothetical protein|nr:hypothetical protein [Schleiferilactobacillus harbinensis]
MKTKSEIWALRIVQNWNQVQYVIGRAPRATTQGEWIGDEQKKVTEIEQTWGDDQWNSGFIVKYDNGTSTFIPLTTEGLITEQRPVEVPNE